MMEMQTLGSFIEQHGGLIQTGPFGSQLHQHEYTEEGVPVVMPKDIAGGRVNEFSVARISENKANDLSRHRLPSGSIVFPRRGEISKCALIDETQEGFLCGTGCIKIEVPAEEYLPRFLYYYLGLRNVVEWLERNAVGTTMLNLNTSILSKLEIPIIPVEQQKAVVSILSAYDDLIENNRRRISLLEQSAQLLYKEWFIRLRFPGHEHTAIVDGLPEGWERVRISEMCTVGRGASPRPIKDFMDGSVPWFKIADATASESPFVFETKEKVTDDGALRSVHLPAGELILSNSATCGVPNFTGVEGCIHDGWLFFKNLQRVSKYFLYCALLSKQRELLQGIGEGATQKNLNTTYVSQQKLLLPKTDDLLIVFEDHLEPIFGEICILAKTNLALGQSRDLLLPRLMSGEITA